MQRHDARRSLRLSALRPGLARAASRGATAAAGLRRSASQLTVETKQKQLASLARTDSGETKSAVLSVL